jgi:hypothetical protein
VGSVENLDSDGASISQNGTSVPLQRVARYRSVCRRWKEIAVRETGFPRATLS